MAKRNNNLNLTFSGLFFAFSIMFFLLWWFRGGINFLPPAVILAVVGVILMFVNFNAGKKKRSSRKKR